MTLQDLALAKREGKHGFAICVALIQAAMRKAAGRAMTHPWTKLNPDRPDDDRMICPTCNGVFGAHAVAKHADRCRFKPRQPMPRSARRRRSVSGTVDGFTITLK